MTSRSDRWSSTAGLSLLEILVVLAIVAIITTVVAGRFVGPSPKLQAEAIAAGLVKQAADIRLEAMLGSKRVILEPILLENAKEIDCDTTAKLRAITFSETGRARGGPICVEVSGQIVTMRVDWLTGQAEARVQ